MHLHIGGPQKPAADKSAIPMSRVIAVGPHAALAHGVYQMHAAPNLIVRLPHAGLCLLEHFAPPPILLTTASGNKCKQKPDDFFSGGIVSNSAQRRLFPPMRHWRNRSAGVFLFRRLVAAHLIINATSKMHLRIFHKKRPKNRRSRNARNKCRECAGACAGNQS